MCHKLEDPNNFFLMPGSLFDLKRRRCLHAFIVNAVAVLHIKLRHIYTQFYHVTMINASADVWDMLGWDWYPLATMTKISSSASRPPSVVSMNETIHNAPLQ